MLLQQPLVLPGGKVPAVTIQKTRGSGLCWYQGFQAYRRVSDLESGCESGFVGGAVFTIGDVTAAGAGWGVEGS